MPIRRQIRILAFLCLPATLSAQGFRGRILAADSSAVAGAIVALVDPSGAVVTRVLTSPLGSYVVRAPGAGRYRLRVLRIGFSAFESPATELAAGSSTEYSPVLPDAVIVLNDIEVAAGGGCHTGSEEAGAAATLLEEVQKAFGSMDLALRDRDLRFQVFHYVRRIDKNLMQVAADSAVESMTTWPVHSLPADQLRDHGFVQSADSVDASLLPLAEQGGQVWFGPDPSTLFADAFLSTHCFRTLVDPADHDRLGLAFAPIHGRHLSDIEGTLWLRRPTLALERLEYHYVNLPRYITTAVTGVAGGKMDFTRLPKGLWVVSRWDLRAPVEQVKGIVVTGVAGWLEEGGRIQSIRTAQGAVIF
ncbi:MAG: carboxypeptidase regulatory-like domain-containing protein [Gemmatimonadetes bacterium]|nr:carboxypeptidase regulatory-like domain-containing protein [Gemmatimonadota bacterium]